MILIFFELSFCEKSVSVCFWFLLISKKTTTRTKICSYTFNTKKSEFSSEQQKIVSVSFFHIYIFCIYKQIYIWIFFIEKKKELLCPRAISRQTNSLKSPRYIEILVIFFVWKYFSFSSAFRFFSIQKRIALKPNQKGDLLRHVFMLFSLMFRVHICISIFLVFVHLAIIFVAKTKLKFELFEKNKTQTTHKAQRKPTQKGNRFSHYPSRAKQKRIMRKPPRDRL